jgi:CheY-like chemotaxis protein
MTGYDVARAIRSDDVLNAIRLVALTGYALPDDVGKAREAGFNMHIAKPATPEQLEQAIEPVRPAARDQRPS